MRRFINTGVILTLLWSDFALRVAAVLVLFIWGSAGVNAVFFGLSLAAGIANNWGPRLAEKYAVWRVKQAKARADTLEGKVYEHHLWH